MSDWLISSFLVSNERPWAFCSGRSPKMCDHERIAHSLFFCKNWAIRSENRWANSQSCFSLGQGYCKVLKSASGRKYPISQNMFTGLSWLANVGLRILQIMRANIGVMILSGQPNTTRDHTKISMQISLHSWSHTRKCLSFRKNWGLTFCDTVLWNWFRRMI